MGARVRLLAGHEVRWFAWTHKMHGVGAGKIVTRTERCLGALRLRMFWIDRAAGCGDQAGDYANEIALHGVHFLCSREKRAGLKRGRLFFC